MLKIIPLLAFHIGSVYLSYEDIKSRSVTLWVLLLVFSAGLINALPIHFTVDLLATNMLFFAVVLSVSFIKQKKSIAWADIGYFLVIIQHIQNLWWVYFIYIGALTIVFHYASGKVRNLPFIAICCICNCSSLSNGLKIY